MGHSCAATRRGLAGGPGDPGPRRHARLSASIPDSMTQRPGAGSRRRERWRPRPARGWPSRWPRYSLPSSQRRSTGPREPRARRQRKPAAGGLQTAAPDRGPSARARQFDVGQEAGASVSRDVDPEATSLLFLGTRRGAGWSLQCHRLSDGLAGVGVGAPGGGASPGVGQRSTVRLRAPSVPSTSR